MQRRATIASARCFQQISNGAFRKLPFEQDWTGRDEALQATMHRHQTLAREKEQKQLHVVLHSLKYRKLRKLGVLHHKHSRQCMSNRERHNIRGMLRNKHSRQRMSDRERHYRRGTLCSVSQADLKTNDVSALAPGLMYLVADSPETPDASADCRKYTSSKKQEHKHTRCDDVHEMELY
jgi:hypothetical protein